MCFVVACVLLMNSLPGATAKGAPAPLHGGLPPLTQITAE